MPLKSLSINLEFLEAPLIKKMANWFIDYATAIFYHFLQIKSSVQYLLENHYECFYMANQYKILPCNNIFAIMLIQL
jgi:hypothetical protein